MAQGFVVEVALGVSRAWDTKARIQAWESPRRGEGYVWWGSRGAESLHPGLGGEPRDGREGKRGPDSPAWCQAAIWPPSHRGFGFIMARRASGEGARSCLGSLCNPDWPTVRAPREEGRGTHVWADLRGPGSGPTHLGSSLPSLPNTVRSLGGPRWCSAPSLCRSSGCGEGAQAALLGS